MVKLEVDEFEGDEGGLVRDLTGCVSATPGHCELKECVDR